jgi:hypothetical protein
LGGQRPVEAPVPTASDDRRDRPAGEVEAPDSPPQPLGDEKPAAPVEKEARRLVDRREESGTAVARRARDAVPCDRPDPDFRGRTVRENRRADVSAVPFAVTRRGAPSSVMTSGPGRRERDAAARS